MRTTLLIALICLFTLAATPESSDKIFIDLSEEVERSEDLSAQIEKADFFQIAMTTPLEYPYGMRLMNDRIFFVDRGGKYRSRINSVVAIDTGGNVLWKNDRKGKRVW